MRAYDDTRALEFLHRTALGYGWLASSGFADRIDVEIRGRWMELQGIRRDWSFLWYMLFLCTYFLILVGIDWSEYVIEYRVRDGGEEDDTYYDESNTSILSGPSFFSAYSCSITNVGY